MRWGGTQYPSPSSPPGPSSSAEPAAFHYLLTYTMTQDQFNEWYEEAKSFFPDDDSRRNGYLSALHDLAEKLGLVCNEPYPPY